MKTKWGEREREGGERGKRREEERGGGRAEGGR